MSQKTQKHFCLKTQSSRNEVALIPVTTKNFKVTLKQQDTATQNYMRNTDFDGTPGAIEYVRDMHGVLTHAFIGIASHSDMWALAHLPQKLQGGYDYVLPRNFPTSSQKNMALGWTLAHYQFDKYKTGTTTSDNANKPHLVVDISDDTLQNITREAAATKLVRDLINTPAEDMNPTGLENAVVNLAQDFNCQAKIVRGDDLLKENFPLIHWVGRAAEDAPRLVEFEWGDPQNPRLAMVGKGVTFDSGGLGIKPGTSMRDMKKDMGGAAHILGLAQMIMSENLPVRLHVVIPIAENAVSGKSYRPGDIKTSRKGITVENEHTDAEGRLLLADALALACEQKPDLLIDFATLTGAQRMAHGMDIAGFTGTDLESVFDMTRVGQDIHDPVWSLPLHQDYMSALASNIADTQSSGGQAGAITAALFLSKFVDTENWFHFDTSAWNSGSRPGRPAGGEAKGMRTAYHYIKRHFT